MYLALLGTALGIVSLIAGLMSVRSALIKATYHNRPYMCGSNLKQLAQASLLYAQDWDDRFPAANVWSDTTLTYLNNRWKYQCPGRDGGPGPEFGYAFNAEVEGADSKRLAAPSSTVLLFESDDDRWNAAHHYLATMPVPGRHYGVNVFAYADGHAERRAHDTAP
jgi:hypothetical protein